ncbi:hypothetical protein P154DRAFT_156819 [Amniculicola lignicola CBS 123094]|uniref:Uncharacterized protein n=1 Tax=Amniculicola lignicola CBS 123094 TaxID=1392246 RepID=A0A6A5WWI1_9PLEO|nr:hypothetical protein P154DRAFT_156819 [Amniculicola lignicola CBS 123094]
MIHPLLCVIGPSTFTTIVECRGRCGRGQKGTIFATSCTCLPVQMISGSDEPSRLCSEVPHKCTMHRYDHVTDSDLLWSLIGESAIAFRPRDIQGLLGERISPGLSSHQV